MELMFPVVLFIGIPLAILLTFVGWKRKDVFRKGKKVANTNFIEDTPLYKKLVRQYKIFSFLSLTFLWIGLILCIFMVARPVKVDIIEPEIHNRDIFICMDISDSMDELNLQTVVKLKEVVKDLDGERFGITIFNARSVLLVPLTSDYDYVMDTLDDLEDAFIYSINKDEYNISPEDYDLYQYKYEGTLSPEGSSYIGDGLAACLYSFPDLQTNDERSRLIIFTTDNELNGVPLVSVEEAAKLCSQNDVKVFALTPEDIVDESSFKAAMNSTGGGFYEVTSGAVFKDLTDDIKLTETSVMQEVKVVMTNKPELLFMGLVVCISLYFYFSRKVRL